jgi:Zn finger protein HypA/HybF involved in hydrogenase expression
MPDTSESPDGPVEIKPTVLCHNCSTFLNETQNDIWECPSCGVRATVQTSAVVDNGS